MKPVSNTRHLFQAFFFASVFILTLRNLLGFTKANLESWCPGGGLESIWFWFKNDAFLCATSGINFIMFLAVLGGTLLLGRAFCSWVCPIGTTMETLRYVGLSAGLALANVWRGIGRRFGILRYVSLIVIVYFTTKITDLIFRPFCPYYVLLAGQEHEMQWWSKWLMLGLVCSAIILPFVFCRLLCPLGALLGLVRKFSPLAPSIDRDNCTSCRACDSACPQQINIFTEGRVYSSDCTQCLNCISACPSECLHLRAGYSSSFTCRTPSTLLPFLVIIMMVTGIAGALWYPIPTVNYSFVSASFPAMASVDSGNIRQTDMIIQGLRCRGTSMTLVQLLSGPEGLIKLETYAGEHRLRLWYDPVKISLDTICDRIDAGLLLTDENTGEQKELKPFKVESLISTP
ncbi:MAG: 4Fe-4S binding protein [Candidatus Riflebacteria bacterium]|nr:4Fe-4S binding protein [Candidatus Riflebacteria bacterium]